MDNETTTIRVSVEAHGALKDMGYSLHLDSLGAVVNHLIQKSQIHDEVVVPFLKGKRSGLMDELNEAVTEYVQGVTD